MEGQESPLYAEVLLDHPSRQLDRPFTYRVPPPLRDKVEVGSIVVVPFLRGRLIGYVLQLSGSTSLSKVRDIERLVEEPPLFGRDSVELCRWMSDYYLTPLAQVLRLIIPPGRGRSLLEEVRLRVPAEDALARVHPRSQAQREVIMFLEREGGSAHLSSIRAMISRQNLHAALRALEEKGLIERVPKLSRPQSDNVSSTMVKLEEAGSKLLEEGSAASPPQKAPSPLQREALRLLAECGGQMPRAQLVRESGISYGSLSALCRKGLLSLRELPRERDPFSWMRHEPMPEVRLTDEQEASLSSIAECLREHRHRTFLLHGITGSGKTEVYLRSIRQALRMGRSSIVLVPEIALTPQMVQRFRGALGSTVAVLHSGLSVGERYDQWQAIKAGGCRVVIGARSALFAPLSDIGLIVIDEEHETTYKENTPPRYHAREVALRRAVLHQAVLVLGSATPQLESSFQARRGEFIHLRLSRRIDDRPLPRVEVVDMRECTQPGMRTILSNKLVNALLAVQESGEQAILFLNRRGFAPYLQCHSCGHIFRCEHCSVSMCYHLEKDCLTCHHCGSLRHPPFKCPDCGKEEHVFRGVGTERVEMELRRLLPELSCLRMDADTTRRKHSHWRILEDFRSRRASVLLGTQMIAKGLDIPSVTLVGVVNADTSLALPDFRAAERTYQLLTQVSGRAGRGERPGRVIIQTFMPENYAIQACLRGDEESFYRQELAWRREAGYPPFCRLINLVISSPQEPLCREASELLREVLESRLPGERVEMLGPAAAPISRLKGRFRYHLLLKSAEMEAVSDRLRDSLAAFEQAKIPLLKKYSMRREELGLAVDVDPVSLL